MLTFNNFLKAANGFLQRNILTLITGKLLCNLEGLGQESLHLTSAVNDLFIFFRQFVHTHNGNNILQLLVSLENTLNCTSGFVMLHTNDFRIQNTRSGIQRINSRINTQRCNTTVQNSSSIQVSKGCSRSRVCQVIRRHIDCLNRCNRTVLSRGDTLLQCTHFRSQCRLIANRRGHTAQ